jgi:hypothetical protein
MLQMVMRASMRERADGLAGVFEHVPGAAADADLGDDRQDDVFGGDAFGSLPSTRDSQVLGALEQALGGQHVLDFAGADAEGQRAKRAVRGGVAVAADDGHARLGQAQLRADHVHDALPGAVQPIERDAELGAVGFHLVGLGAGDDDVGVGAVAAVGAGCAGLLSGRPLSLPSRSPAMRTVTSPIASMPSVMAWTTNSSSVFGAC